MTIKEQIEIARLIASGTPREVAIQEQFRGKMSATADRSGAIETGVVTPQDAAKKRLQKVRQAGQRLKSNVKVAALNAKFLAAPE